MGKSWDLFNHILKKLNIEEFEHIASNLYFKKEWSGIGEKDSVIDWIMYFGADSAWEGDTYIEKLRFFHESPQEFEKWWKENITSSKK